MKKALSLVLSFALVLGLSIGFTSKPSEAFMSKKKITLIAGETYKIEPSTANNIFTYAKSSAKKVATVKKTKRSITITAKKKGKTTVTIKTKEKVNYKYIVTVVKKNITWKAMTPYNTISETTGLNDSSVMFEIVNKIGFFIPTVKIDFEVYGASGALLFNGTQQIEEVLPNKKLHMVASALNLNEPVKTAKITRIEFIDRFKTMGYKYLDKSDSITITETARDGDNITLYLKNDLSEPIQGVADIVFYADAAAQKPISYSKISLYTNAKGTNYLTIPPAKGYQTYKIFKRAYIIKY